MSDLIFTNLLVFFNILALVASVSVVVALVISHKVTTKLTSTNKEDLSYALKLNVIAKRVLSISIVLGFMLAVFSLVIALKNLTSNGIYLTTGAFWSSITFFNYYILCQIGNNNKRIMSMIPKS